VLYDPGRRQVAFASGPSLERAGISGRVFLDSNGDGRWQPGEQSIGGVRVRAGFVTTLSDSSGRYRIWDLPAFEPGEYELSVDPSVLARLGLSAGPIAFTVPSSAEGATVDGLELRLE
jgi:hypothetical protein